VPKALSERLKKGATLMQKKIGKALVVGAGISGIRSALDLAETGYAVLLIDREPYLGGILSRLDRQFPTHRCGMCKMLPLVERDRGAQFCLRKGLFHENIQIRTATQLTSVEGEPGHMTVRLRRAPTGVDGQRCVGCGLCAECCPVEVPDLFNAGLGLRKAIYRPVPHAVSDPYVVDFTACTRCGECEAVCPTRAIDLAGQQRRQFRILVVDDERVVRDSLKEWLLDEGFSVEMAESGEQALQRLESEAFHLMLTDIKMPGMDGVELLQQAKERHPDLTVIMMTAYATVETAVEAMKIGALDYLMKPFDPQKMIPMVAGIYADRLASQDEEVAVGAVVLAGGVDYFDPGGIGNLYGYGVNPHVLTQMEFERLLSGTGPTGGRLLRPADGKPVKKIAFLQCVGSRDLKLEADFCSTVCCMISVKQAMLAKEKEAGIDATIFYMDLRAAGLSYERLCDQARHTHHVRFERSRVHSLWTAPDGRGPTVRHAAMDGRVRQESFDLVVLATGQRPAAGGERLAELAGLQINPWGFIQTRPFSSAATDNPGVLAAGACTGLVDISESVVQASAAAAEAGRLLFSAGGGLSAKAGSDDVTRDVSAEPPKVRVIVCTCGNRLNQLVEPHRLATRLQSDPCVEKVLFEDRLCSDEGWDRLVESAAASHSNRVLVGACHPYGFLNRMKTLAQAMNLAPRLVEAVDLKIYSRPSGPLSGDRSPWTRLSDALIRLKHIDPRPADNWSVIRKALVVGGGISGMQAALSIADQGYPVALVEKDEALGGNLQWLRQTVEGYDVRRLLTQTIDRVAKHPRITVYLNTCVKGAYGQVGQWRTTVETRDRPPQTLEHGVVVLATGGNEAPTRSLGYGAHAAIVTQKELERGLAEARIDPQKLGAVVMLLCVDSRREPRNYCSRVCCPTAVKHALHLKKKNPDVTIYVLYRDVMTCGFTETYYSQAREAGVIFMHYHPKHPPQVRAQSEEKVEVLAQDRVLAAPLTIDADLVVLATGIVPALPDDLAAAYGAEVDPDGFFRPADTKWRPVEALAQSVFACGIAHSPRNVTESIATARAAAQRALHLLSRPFIVPDHLVAHVRHMLCSLCQRCIEACPFAARTLNPEMDRMVVNPVLCQGCGACATACPNGAAVVQGFSQGLMLETIDAALEA
jgi:heterodisulfide reductase subunit A